MVKRIYRSKTINANGTPVIVRQVFGKGDSQARQKMVSIASAAKGWLTHALPECRSNPSPGVADAYESCFIQPPSSAGMNTVRSVLSQVSSRLTSKYGVKILDDSDAYGYVSRRYGGRVHLVDGVIQYDEDGDAISSRGEIHLDKTTVLTNPLLATITLIHEATHKFSNLRDFGNQGYFKDDFSGYVAPGLTWNNALRNADSYAIFVYKVMQTKFHSVVVI
jgi:hypothetical protein